jgi:hypothetical protein
MTITFAGMPDEGLQVSQGGPGRSVHPRGVLRNASRYLEGEYPRGC